MCQRCGTPADTVRNCHPWCSVCGQYLVHDPEYGDWTTFADREYRRRTAGIQQRITASAEHVAQAVAAVHDRLPADWHAVACQHIDGATHTLDIQPPAGSIDAIAYLIPPTGRGDGWLVRVHNRTRHLDFPLYHAGGARAASFGSASEALDAAIEALRIEIVSAGYR